MAFGAVLFSLPLATFLALYGYVIQGMAPAQSLLVYTAIGTVVMIAVTFAHGLRSDDFG